MEFLRKSNGLKAWAGALLGLAVFGLGEIAAHAEIAGIIQQDFTNNLEKVQVMVRENKNPSALPVFKEIHVFRYQALDLNTLEALIVNDPSHLYEVAPHTSSPFFRSTPVNLIRLDTPLQSPWRLDLRVSSKIALESRTPWFDALVLGNPLQRRLSLGLGHRFSPETSLFGFIDPLSTEILAILGHRLRSNLDLQMLFYRDPRFNKNEVIATCKFSF